MTEVDKAFLKYYGLDDSEIEHAEEEWDFREEDNYDLFKAGADCRQAEIDALKRQLEKAKTEKCTTCKYNTVGQDEYIRGLEEQTREQSKQIAELEKEIDYAKEHCLFTDCEKVKRLEAWIKENEED